MKKALKGIALVSLFVALLIPATAFAGGGPIVIKDLPYTISKPGNYTLTKSLTYTTNRTDAITITSDGVILDLGGFSITGPGMATAAHQGVAIFGNGVEVRNGYISGFYYGLFANNSISPKASNLKIHDNLFGIDFESSAFGTEVKDCKVYSNGRTGIYVAAAGGLITNNVTYNNGTDTANYGIYVNSGSCVIGNSSSHNSGTGIYAGDGCTVKSNSACGNTDTGIITFGTVLLDGNASTGNTTQYLLSGGTITGTNTP